MRMKMGLGMKMGMGTGTGVRIGIGMGDEDGDGDRAQLHPPRKGGQHGGKHDSSGGGTMPPTPTHDTACPCPYV